MYCQRCGHPQSVANSRYCENCAQPLPVNTQAMPPTLPRKKYPTWIYGVAGFGAICLLCCGGLLASKDDKRRTMVISEASRADALSSKPEPTLAPSPTPTPDPDYATIGEPPENSAWDGSVKPAEDYLRLVLNDFDSAKYDGWTKPVKTKHKGHLCWKVTARLRAKNKLGAYVLSVPTFYIQKGLVIGVEGLR